MESKTISYFLAPTKRQFVEEHKKDREKKDREKKRVVSEKWTFTTEDYIHSNQLTIVKQLKTNAYKSNDEISKVALQEINKKIYGYKHQDTIKHHLDEAKFIHLDAVISKMIECELKCYYCNCEMNVLYDIAREAKQWTVDRINNDLGHNVDNFYLACLECNLKRRRRSDDKFFFTKQMKLVKVPGENE